MTDYVPLSVQRFVRDVVPALHAASDGQRAIDLVEQIVATDRWNSFDRFHETSRTLKQAYEQAGAVAEIEPIQTGGRLGSGRWVIHEALDIHSATLDIVSPVHRRLADYHQNPWHVAHLGAATGAEGVCGQLVVLDEYEQMAQLRPGQLRNKIVLTRRASRWTLKHLSDAGAVAVICDYDVHDLPDAVHWMKFGWGGIALELGPTRMVGFSLSGNQGRELRALQESQGPLVLEARADIRRYVGTHDVVSGLVLGRDDPHDEVWAIAHSAEPGAVDNASGVATCVEVAHILESLIAQGTLPRPRRTIRMVNAFECYGFFAYLEQHRRLQPPMAGINLDGVGVKPEHCGRGLHWHATIPMSASFVDRIGEAFVMGAHAIDDPGYEYSRKEFVATSDTLIGDPKYGFPCPWLTTHSSGWGKFTGYHSSFDTPDLLCDRGMRLCATATAGYLYYLANAGSDEVLEIADAETRRIKAKLAQAAGPEARYLRQRHQLSLQRLERWIWQGDRAAIVAQLDDQRRSVAEAMPDAPALTLRGREAKRVPRRTALLTPTGENAMVPRSPRRRRREHRGGVMPWALYWADGQLNYAQIAELLSVEYNEPVTIEQVTKLFERHAELGYVEVIEPKDMIRPSRLKRDLRALGLRRGMDVMVHSSLSRIGHVIGGADAVVQTLLQVIGSKATLMMPSFNHRRGIVYNPRTTPTTNGAIPDAMWRRGDAVRSDHPTHPVAAIGPRAEEYCRDHAELGVWSMDSPIGRLIQAGGYILSIGVSHSSTTVMHVAEVNVPCGCIDQFANAGLIVAHDGSLRPVRSVAFRDGRCPVPIRDLDEALRQNPQQRQGKVGHADSTLVKASHVYDTRLEQLRNVCPTCTIRPKAPVS